MLAIKNNVGEWVYDKEQVKAIMISYFSNLFTDDVVEDLHTIPADIFLKLPTRDREQLKKPFTRIKIKEVVKN